MKKPDDRSRRACALRVATLSTGAADEGFQPMNPPSSTTSPPSSKTARYSKRLPLLHLECQPRLRSVPACSSFSPVVRNAERCAYCPCSVYRATPLPTATRTARFHFPLAFLDTTRDKMVVERTQSGLPPMRPRLSSARQNTGLIGERPIESDDAKRYRDCAGRQTPTYRRCSSPTRASNR